MGLDRPPHIRYLDWIWDAARGDLGQSAKSNASISEIMGGRLRHSAMLAVLAFVIAVPLGLVMGVWVGPEPTPRWTGSSPWEDSSRSPCRSS